MRQRKCLLQCLPALKINKCDDSVEVKVEFMNVGMPSNIIETIQLAIVIIFTISTVAELIAVIAARGHGVINLGLQITALTVALYVSRGWIYPLMFSNLMASSEQFSQIILTIAMLSASFGLDS